MKTLKTSDILQAVDLGLYEHGVFSA